MKRLVNELKVRLLREGARAPYRAHRADAGADVYYCHNPGSGQPDVCRIGPGASHVIPTGIRVEVPEGYMLEVKNKSGIASKRQLIVGACVIDSGYDGEVFVNLHNIGESEQQIRPGDRLAQLVLVPIESCDFVVTEGAINEHTVRGAGGFGSTGTR